jgi:hypothetical protein
LNIGQEGDEIEFTYNLQIVEQNRRAMMVREEFGKRMLGCWPKNDE